MFAGLGGWPINDDPFYAKPLAIWSESGRWQPVRQNGRLTASSVAHVLSGGLAVSRGRFSYRGLYLVCIAQQALGAAALFVAARVLNASAGLGFLAVATLATFPLFFGHAFTFMTDGPATAWAALACVSAALGVVRRDWRWLLATSLAVGWGYWIRQTNGLLILAPLAALALLRWQARGRESSGSPGGEALRPSAVHFAALLLASGGAVLLLESGWLSSSSLSRAGDVAPHVEAADYLHRTLVAAYGWLLICGWFALPWAVTLAVEAWRAGRSLPVYASRLCATGAAMCLLGGLAPLASSRGRACLTSATGAFIQNAHFGPIFLSDMDEPGRWGQLGGVVWPWWIWQALSVLSIVSCACLAWWGVLTVIACFQRSASDAGDARPASALGLLVMIGLSVLAIVVMIEPHMDRYWLFLLPAVAVWWLHLAGRYGWRLSRGAAAWAVLCLAFNAGMSLVFTHDMLAWNDVRWRFVEGQLAAGVPADQLDGGRDVNAWLRMDEDPDTRPRAGDDSPWWSGRASLALAVGDRPGWHRTQRLPWHAWATGRTHYLLVLQRGPAPAQPLAAQAATAVKEQPCCR